MTHQTALQAILNSDTPNSALFKKYLLCLSLGWFRVNGCPPLDTYKLHQYLDDKSIMLDFTRLTPDSKKAFLDWFYAEATPNAFSYFGNKVTNETRGYSAEADLSVWGKITNWLFYKKKTWCWKLSEPVNTTLPQVTDLDICKGEHGLLVNLNQQGIRTNNDKYQATDDEEAPLNNTKRVYLSDDLVQQLISTDITKIDFNKIINEPHSHAIKPKNIDYYFQDMQYHRQSQLFTIRKPWYTRIIPWIRSWFKPQPTPLKRTYDFQEIKESDTVVIKQCKRTNYVSIIEKPPEKECFVFSGGGSKMYALIGAYKVCQKKKLKPTTFVGSSAGAIAATICYLGYTHQEFKAFLQSFRQDLLVYYDIDRRGISDISALKSAIDYMIVSKVNELIKQYAVDSTADGQAFLNENLYEVGEVTFAFLKMFKERYPDCCLGKNLIMTTTSVRQQTTNFYSMTQNAHEPVGKICAISASLPVMFKASRRGGEDHIDGGASSNTPAEGPENRDVTFIQPDFNNRLDLLIFQFDNGPEQTTLERILPNGVYRINFFWNWVYRILTGIRDPASGWEKDLQKLRRYSNQVILIPVDNVSSFQFSLNPQQQSRLILNGKEAAKNYLKRRYKRVKGSENYEMKDYLYMNFINLEEALYYCCFRKREDWFNKLLALGHSLSEEKISFLRHTYFQPLKPSVPICTELPNPLKKILTPINGKNNLQLFPLLFQVMIKISDNMFRNATDLSLFKYIRHHTTLRNLLGNVQDFNRITGEVHVFVRLFVYILTRLSNQKMSYQDAGEVLQQLHSNLLQPGLNPRLFMKNSLNDSEASELFNAYKQKDLAKVSHLCQMYEKRKETVSNLRSHTSINTGHLYSASGSLEYAEIESKFG